jgi:hypothetical protein
MVSLRLGLFGNQLVVEGHVFDRARLIDFDRGFVAPGGECRIVPKIFGRGKSMFSASLLACRDFKLTPLINYICDINILICRSGGGMVCPYAMPSFDENAANLKIDVVYQIWKDGLTLR